MLSAFGIYVFFMAFGGFAALCFVFRLSGFKLVWFRGLGRFCLYYCLGNLGFTCRFLGSYK